MQNNHKVRDGVSVEARDVVLPVVLESHLIQNSRRFHKVRDRVSARGQDAVAAAVSELVLMQVKEPAAVEVLDEEWVADQWQCSKIYRKQNLMPKIKLKLHRVVLYR